jgi:CRP-like cAMP-binding protein
VNQKKSRPWLDIIQRDNCDEARELLNFLRDSPLFRSLSKRELRNISAIAHKRTYQDGEYVFRKGQPGAAMFIIRSGQVEVIDHEGLDHYTTIATLGPDALFGELAMLDDSPRSASVKALAITEIFAFFRSDLERLLAAFPQIGLQVYRSLALIIGHRLKQTNAQLFNH